MRRWVLRIIASVLVALACAVPSRAQSSGLTVSISATPNPVPPAALLTVTLTVTNEAGAAADVVAGIDDSISGTLLQTSASPGLLVVHQGDCALGSDCGEVFTGFRTRLGAHTAATLSLTFRIFRPPGATFPMAGFVARTPAPYAEIERASVTLTVAGSGVPSSSPPTLVESRLAQTGVNWVIGREMVFDPATRVYVAGGADETGTIVAGLNLDGMSTGTPLRLYSPPGPFPSVDSPDLVYSDALGPAAAPGGVMVTWYEDTHVYVRALSRRAFVTPRTYLGEGRYPQIAYSAARQQFLVVWAAAVGGSAVSAQRVGLDAQPIGPVIHVADSSDGTSHPFGLAWNRVTDEFGVSLSAYAPPLPYIDFIRIAIDGTLLSRTRVAAGGDDSLPLLAANSRTGEYVLLWLDGGTLFGAEIRKDGRVVSRGLLATQSDACCAESIKFHPLSGTFLVAGSGLVWELNQYGTPLTAPMRLRNRIAFPIASPHPDLPVWRVAGSVDPSGGAFTPTVALASEEIRTSTIGGGSEARLGGCTLPDPFVAFGGSVCYDGGWLPPGVPAPGTSITYLDGCSTPDPFVAFGGGRCLSGGWYPPTANAPPPTPTPTPSPGTGGCMTPDPFVAFGGGRCVNGGWYPPGMDAPAQPAPAPAPAPGGCITPDPFVALGGGRCIGGGWYPPGMGNLAPSVQIAPATVYPSGTIALLGSIRSSSFRSTRRAGSVEGALLSASSEGSTLAFIISTPSRD
jgi:hypothetical protein